MATPPSSRVHGTIGHLSTHQRPSLRGRRKQIQRVQRKPYIKVTEADFDKLTKEVMTATLLPKTVARQIVGEVCFISDKVTEGNAEKAMAEIRGLGERRKTPAGEVVFKKPGELPTFRMKEGEGTPRGLMPLSKSRKPPEGLREEVFLARRKTDWGK